MQEQKKAKTIGIVGYKNDRHFGVGANYLEFVSFFGNPRIMMPGDDFVPDLDLLVLPGGLDLNPVNAGKVPSFNTTNTDVMKQYFYEVHLKKYIGKVPIFGICLGFQQLACFFGSKLTQDLKMHKNSLDRWEEGHKISVVGSKKKLPVNSHHHQAILLEDLGSDLKPLATSFCEDSGKTFKVKNYSPIVEAFEHKVLPIAGVQWHPEEFYDEFAVGLVEKLIEEPQLEKIKA